MESMFSTERVCTWRFVAIPLIYTLEWRWSYAECFTITWSRTWGIGHTTCNNNIDSSTELTTVPVGNDFTAKVKDENESDPSIRWNPCRIRGIHPVSYSHYRLTALLLLGSRTRIRAMSGFLMIPYMLLRWYSGDTNVIPGLVLRRVSCKVEKITTLQACFGSLLLALRLLVLVPWISSGVSRHLFLVRIPLEMLSWHLHKVPQWIFLLSEYFWAIFCFFFALIRSFRIVEPSL